MPSLLSRYKIIQTTISDFDSSPIVKSTNVLSKAKRSFVFAFALLGLLNLRSLSSSVSIAGGSCPTDAFGWFQPLVDSGEVSLHTAGSLQEGRKVWVLAKVNAPALEITAGDKVERFVLLSNSHDGTRAVRAGFTPIRVVCANTLRMAHNADSEENKVVKMLHTKNVKTALETLRETMQVANTRFEATAEQYRRLAKCKVSRADLRKYVKIVLGVEKEDEKDLPTQTMNKIRSILVLAEKGKGNDGKTLWAAYNGVTEYLGYEYGRTPDRRLDALWFGPSATLSQKALDVALTMAS